MTRGAAALETQVAGISYRVSGLHLAPDS